MFKYKYGIMCNEKYFYEIEADNTNDALAVAREFFEDDCAHGLCGKETSYRTGSVEWVERLDHGSIIKQEVVHNVSCN